ncbi:MAG TPA: ATP-binding protein, partial [Polyangiales bacterium]|nr:ATP-binding protein [Polyangiales bacterium]
MSTHELPIGDHADVVRVRHEVRAWAARHGFSVVDQTKIVTAASELARNTLVYGLGGSCTIEWIDEQGRNGLRLVFADSGPGIPDIQAALRDGFT